MNEHDSEKLAGMLVSMGYEESSSKENANIIIINTCSVREHADEKFFGFLGQLKIIKSENPNNIVAICGCMMQQEHIISRIKEKYPFVDLIFGTHNLHKFPELVLNIIQENSKVMDIWDENGEIIEGLPSKRKYDFKAFVNIMNGCNNFCTYCIVPYTRGRERSRDPKEIISEINNLAQNGVKEITLLGQNVNSYGNETNYNTSFSELIYKINEIKEIKRIRFMTSHPKDFSIDLINAYSECENLCKHLHLPVQSGSTNILKSMNRYYSKQEYIDLVTKLKAKVPGIAITTDIIVGFPGETEEDFQETLDLVSKVGFDLAYTFLFSERKGTPAATYPNQIPKEIKQERFARLVDRLNAIADLKNKAYLNTITNVLVEGQSKNNKNYYTGRTESFKPVNFSAKESDIGQIIPVLITGAKTFSLFGESVR
jgi:tRNA-2-methylthio-N6-dimethylallyladenosine synthase